MQTKIGSLVFSHHKLSDASIAVLGFFLLEGGNEITYTEVEANIQASNACLPSQKSWQE